MDSDLIIADRSESQLVARLPRFIIAAGPEASRSFLEFFTANIRNLNTRLAYARAVMRFARWCDRRKISLQAVDSIRVAAYIEDMTRTHAAPTVKQHLAAIRMLFDWLVTHGQVMRFNPAAVVRGPKHVVRKGKTPVLTGEEARTLLDSIDTATIVGLRDRALIATMVYSFARISAVTGMDVDDYFLQGKRSWFRLHEKGGKHHEVPAHHNAEEYLDAYVAAAGLVDQHHTPLFRTVDRLRHLTNRRLRRDEAWRMIKRRAKQAGLSPAVCCHTFRATGITVYLSNGGELEKAQQIAAHESPRTTKLYDRTNDQLTLDEIEKIQI